jgi:3-hydroxyacyl-CoA dehydrogenase
MFVFKAAVLGAGTMGGEIAQVIASADVPVVMKDVKQEFVDAGVEKAREVTKGQLAGLVGKEKITQEQADARFTEITGLITGTTGYEGFGEVDFVVEAVPEKMEVKQSVFAELDELTSGHAILASNTSALSISEIGSATTRPDKVVGFHFFYPASVMRLIEVVEGEDTSEETAQAAANFAMQVRKNPIRCQEDPGFVVNRVLNSAASEIWRHADESGEDPQEIDKRIAEAKVTPMGPFFLTDLLGLDTVLHVAEHLRDAYGERFYVHPKMKQLVENGKLGQKTGEGYYTHGDGGGGDAEGEG